MNVLSLFDGCSGGQQALDRLGIKVDNYYASEIDRFAIQVTMANYPNTIQLGSVVDVDISKLEKIDLLCGGSPCQSFSFAGKRKGMSTKDSIEILTLEDYLELKSQNFEFEGQSYLFWEYMRILTDIRKVNPNIKFLLENVMMGEKWQRILTQAIGINPIEINSALISAQNRRRLYWTNIGAIEDGFFGDLKCAITQPKDKGILLKDILEKEVDDKYYLKEKSFIFDRIENNHPVTPRIPNLQEKANCIKIGGSGVDDLVFIDNNSINKNLEVIGGDFRYDEGFRWRENGKSGTLSTKGASENNMSSIPLAKIQGKIRRLTVLEFERLQTVKDNYTAHVSDTQRYKMLGNGWTIDVIAHILNFM